MEYMQVKNSKIDAELSHFARAIAIPARITILRILLLNSEWVPFDAFAEIPLGFVSLDRHLKAMLYLKIIKERRLDRMSYYSIDKEGFVKLSKEFLYLFQLFENSESNPLNSKINSDQ